MSILDNITVEYFKTLFVRDFPYLPVYVAGQAYFEGDVVYYEPNFFTSLIDKNTTSPDNTDNWALYNDSVNNYIQDSDIERAFSEARVNFNPALFGDEDTAKMVFCYLAAHYLVIDLNNANNPLGLGIMGYTRSKTVGSVSESYDIPEWLLKNPVLSSFATTGYGRKYLSLLQPYLVGNIILSKGRTTYG